MGRPRKYPLPDAQTVAATSMDAVVSETLAAPQDVPAAPMGSHDQAAPPPRNHPAYGQAGVKPMGVSSSVLPTQPPPEALAARPKAVKPVSVEHKAEKHQPTAHSLYLAQGVKYWWNSSTQPWAAIVVALSPSDPEICDLAILRPDSPTVTLMKGVRRRAKAASPSSQVFSNVWDFADATD